jgi:hypothetical protein
VIKLSAREAGEAINLIHVEAEEAVKAHGRMVVQVVDRRKEKDQTPPQPRSLKTSSNHSGSKPLATVNQTKPATECCCQKVISPRFPSANLLP